jgi:3-oxoacyl-[acyl-carrier-protein] synthase-3
MGKKMPDTIVSNEDLAKSLDTSDEWIISKTGISTRMVCKTESLTDIAEEAARNALENAGLDISQIDMIICATVTGDCLMPSLACCVLERLGGKCAAFDVNAACSGFIYALDTGAAFISAGRAKNILLVCADAMSRLVDWDDRSTCILFGDGAAACIITAGHSLKYIRTHADPQPAMLSAKTLNTLQMQGQNVYKFAVKTIESEITLALSALNKTADAVDYFILHQANARIIDGARTRLKLPAPKFPMNIQKFGNMSAASIPVLLCEMFEDGRLKPGDLCMMMGFGAGMTAGTAVIEI